MVPRLEQHPGRDLLVRLVVLGQQDAQAAPRLAWLAFFHRVGRDGIRRPTPDVDRRWVGLLEPGGEPERAAASGRALDADFAAHQLAKLLGDREPQSGAAVSACHACVGLAELAEQAESRLRGNTNASVGYGEAEFQRALFQRALGDVYRHTTFFSEFEGVSEQVEQDLADTARVTLQHGRYAGGNLDRERQTLA